MDGTDDLRTPGGLVVPGQSLRWSFSRAQGAGGQHVNKTATKVTLEIDIDAIQGKPTALERLRHAHPDGVRVTSQTTRSQWRNRIECLDKLTELLDTTARPPSAPRRASRPTRGSVERRLTAKRKTGEKKVGRRGASTPDW